MGYTKGAGISQGYCSVPLTEVERDWKKVAFANRLLRTGWTVYRNAAELGSHPAGSFFVPLDESPLSEGQAASFLSKQAQELGISIDFHRGDLPLNGLTWLVRPQVAVLYATGEKWALMALKVFETMEFDTSALSAEDIRHGALEHANVLFIPGGTHTDKAAELGSEGEAMVKEFLKKGGGVLGFCGGGALSAKIQGGWGLLAVERESGKIPKTMHGPIWVKPEKAGHPLWYGYPVTGYPLAPWYGRAFHPLNAEVKVLGRYDKPTDDFYIDHELTGSYFSEYLPEEVETLNTVYDGYADPASLAGKVAIAEGKNGAGRIIVSYPHPETPGLEGGFLLLANAVFYVTQNPPPAKRCRLPAGSAPAIYERDGVLSMLDELSKTHTSSVMPVAKDLVGFGINNLYWTPRPHIPWCYIGGGKYSFYICERLEAYSDEIMRHLDGIPCLIHRINASLDCLLSLREPRINGRLKGVREHLENIYCRGGQGLVEILEAYRSCLNADLADWAVNFKRLLLYRQLLSIMKDKGAGEKLVADVTRRSQKLAVECLGGWRWVDTSQKYKGIFNTLDNICCYLSNLKFELADIELQLNSLLARSAGS